MSSETGNVPICSLIIYIYKDFPIKGGAHASSFRFGSRHRSMKSNAWLGVFQKCTQAADLGMCLNSHSSSGVSNTIL